MVSLALVENSTLSAVDLSTLIHVALTEVVADVDVLLSLVELASVLRAVLFPLTMLLLVTVLAAEVTSDVGRELVV